MYKPPKPPLGRLRNLEQMRLSGGTDYKSTDSRSTLGGHVDCRTPVNIPKSSLRGQGNLVKTLIRKAVTPA